MVAPPRVDEVKLEIGSRLLRLRTRSDGDPIVSAVVLIVSSIPADCAVTVDVERGALSALPAIGIRVAVP